MREVVKIRNPRYFLLLLFCLTKGVCSLKENHPKLLNYSINYLDFLMILPIMCLNEAKKEFNKALEWWAPGK